MRTSCPIGRALHGVACSPCAPSAPSIVNCPRLAPQDRYPFTYILKLHNIMIRQYHLEVVSSPPHPSNPTKRELPAEPYCCPARQRLVINLGGKLSTRRTYVRTYVCTYVRTYSMSCDTRHKRRWNRSQHTGRRDERARRRMLPRREGEESLKAITD